ncbi:MAG TPA: head GIN domain-containing protein [Puia sp.]|nr:head GIN domain-containing protein [Puia sp.]
MKKILFSTALLTFTILSFAQSGKVIEDKNAETRNVKGFHAIHVSSGIDLYLTQGNEEAVAVSASDPKYISHIVTTVNNGVLVIKYENTGSITWNLGNKKLKAYVSIKDIDGLDASGGSDAYLQGTIKSDKLHIDLSGGSDLKGRIDAHEMSITQSGGSDVDISGSVTDLDVDASGGSDLNGYELITDNCKITASGGSDSHITVNKELSANASGGSDIYYKGTGVVHLIKSSGSSSITKKG